MNREILRPTLQSTQVRVMDVVVVCGRIVSELKGEILWLYSHNFNLIQRLGYVPFSLNYRSGTIINQLIYNFYCKTCLYFSIVRPVYRSFGFSFRRTFYI